MKMVKLLALLISILSISPYITASNYRRYDKLVYSLEGDYRKKKMSVKDKQELRLLLDRMESQCIEYDEKCDTVLIICEWITESTCPINVYYKSSMFNNIPVDIESKYSLLFNDDLDEFNKYYLSASKTFEAYDTIYKIIYENEKISKASFMATLYCFIKDSDHLGLELYNE